MGIFSYHFKVLLQFGQKEREIVKEMLLETL